MRFYVRVGRINFRDGSFDWKLKDQVTVLRVTKRDRRVSTPLPSRVFPRIHSIKFLDSHFVQNSPKFNYYKLGVEKSSIVPRTRIVTDLSCKFFRIESD